MAEKRCPTCGSTAYETRLVEYVYRHNGNYLIVRVVPAQVCSACGTRFYRAEVLEDIERRFFAIHRDARKPEQSVEVPDETYQPAWLTGPRQRLTSERPADPPRLEVGLLIDRCLSTQESGSCDQRRRFKSLRSKESLWDLLS